MEDEETVAGAFTEMLSYLGYEISIAVNGSEAISHYAQAMEHDRPFAAVILDLTIRGGEGAERVLARLLELNPEVKVIIASGYSVNTIMANYQRHGFAGVIHKPFTLNGLAEAVEKVL